jgi:hypothetical protein
MSWSIARRDAGKRRQATPVLWFGTVGAVMAVAILLAAGNRATTIIKA